MMLSVASFARFLLGPARDGASKANTSRPIPAAFWLSLGNRQVLSTSGPGPAGWARWGGREPWRAQTGSTEGRGPAGSGWSLKMSDCGLGVGPRDRGGVGQTDISFLSEGGTDTQPLSGPGA